MYPLPIQTNDQGVSMVIAPALLPDMMSEKTLIQLVKQRNTEAFVSLYQQFSPGIYKSIIRVIPNPEAACRVLEKSFCAIWNNIHSYEPSRQRFFSWMLQITIRQCIKQAPVSKAEIVNSFSFPNEVKPELAK